MILGKYQVAICRSKTGFTCAMCDFKHMDINGTMDLDYASDECREACGQVEVERDYDYIVFFKIVGPA